MEAENEQRRRIELASQRAAALDKKQQEDKSRREANAAKFNPRKQQVCLGFKMTLCGIT